MSTPPSFFTPYCVAAVQMLSTPDVQRNLDEAAQLIATAVDAGAKLVLLPEYFCLMGRKEEDKLACCEPHGAGPIQRFLADAARAHQIWLIGGALPMAIHLPAPDPSHVFNTTLVFDPTGRERARYDKIHLFNFDKDNEYIDEARTIRAGNMVCTFDAPFGRVGLSICYDLRFPELYRQMGDVALIVVPAAFTYPTGRAHWEILLRARAIENQCYVLAAAQGGTHENGRRTWGHSMLIDPWGEIVALRAEAGPGVIVGGVERARIDEVRRNLPAWRHRVFK